MVSSPLAFSSSKSLLKCSANTAKVVVFTFNGLCILFLTLLFRQVDRDSPIRSCLLIGIIINCFFACVLGTLFGSLDCRRTNVEIRASRQPIVFTIRLPIENTITIEHMNFFNSDKCTVGIPHPPMKAAPAMHPNADRPPPYELINTMAISRIPVHAFPDMDSSFTQLNDTHFVKIV